MKLYEHEGKALLARNGVRIPLGQLMTSRAQTIQRVPCVVKAQVLSGGRGRAGGVRVCHTATEAQQAVADLLGSTVLGESVAAVLVEERVAVEAEFYLSLVVDRASRGPVFLLSDQGGVDIEHVATDRIARVAVDPLEPLRVDVDVAHALAGQLGRERDAALAVSLLPVLQAVLEVFTESQSELVEINPLGFESGGGWIALDAKVVVDDNAALHSAAFADVLAERRGLTPWERSAANLGMSAVEMGGDVLVIAGGAGASMATADVVAARGMSLAGVVDLSGGITLDRDTSLRAMRALAELDAPVVLYNAFTQVAHCDAIAEAIVDGFGQMRERVVVRMKGNRAQLGRQLLSANGFRVDEELGPACEQVRELVGRDGTGGSNGHLP